MLENETEVDSARSQGTLQAVPKKLVILLLVVWEPLKIYIRGQMGSELCFR